MCQNDIFYKTSATVLRILFFFFFKGPRYMNIDKKGDLRGFLMLCQSPTLLQGDLRVKRVVFWLTWRLYNLGMCICGADLQALGFWLLMRFESWNLGLRQSLDSLEVSFLFAKRQQLLTDLRLQDRNSNNFGKQKYIAALTAMLFP